MLRFSEGDNDRTITDDAEYNNNGKERLVTGETFVTLSLKRRREHNQHTIGVQPPVRKKPRKTRVSRKQRERELAKRRPALALLPVELWYLILTEHVPRAWAVPAYFVCKTWAAIMRRRYYHRGSPPPPAARLRMRTLGLAFLRSCLLQQDLGLMRWAQTRGWRWRLGAQVYAAEHGRIDSLQWLLQRQLGGRFSHRVMHGAIRGGQLATLQWLYRLADEDRCYRPPHPLYHAVKHGRPRIAEWLLTGNRGGDGGVQKELCPQLFVDACKKTDSPEVLELLYRHCGENTAPPAPARLVLHAIEAGHMRQLRYLREQRRVKFNAEMFRAAAASGRLGVVRYICTQTTAPRRRTWCAVEQASCGGHMHVVRFLHETVGQPLNQTVLTQACWRGDIEAVRYCLKEGVRPVRETYYYAAMRHNLELIQLLYTEHPPRSHAGWHAVMRAADDNPQVEAWYTEVYGAVLRRRRRKSSDAPGHIRNPDDSSDRDST